MRAESGRTSKGKLVAMLKESIYLNFNQDIIIRSVELAAYLLLGVFISRDWQWGQGK